MYGPSLNIVQHRLTSSIDISSFGLRGAGAGVTRLHQQLHIPLHPAAPWPSYSPRYHIRICA